MEREDFRPSVLLHGDFASRFNLASSFARAFETIGCDVYSFDTSEHSDELAFWVSGRLGWRLSQKSMTMTRLGSRTRNEQLVVRARELSPDLLLVIGGDFLLPEAIREIRDQGTVTAIFQPDSPMPESTNHRPELLKAGREADRYLIWSEQLASRLENAGLGPVHYLPFAWDREIYPHVGLSDEPEYEVTFIGGWDRWRERWLEPVADRFDLTVWGPKYWGSRTRPGSPLRAAWQGRAVRGEEAADVIGRSRVVLNVLREQNLPDGTNMRTFEVPGAGGFLLSHRSEGAVEIFPENEGGAYFGSRREMLAQIAHYLNEPQARSDIAHRAHEIIVQQQHRYADRAAEVLRVCEFV